MDNEIEWEKLEYSTVEKPKYYNPSIQFGHLFNAYTQAINKKFKRTGNLFEKPFERKMIDSDKYFQNLIFYIHNNPVVHGFTNNINNYAWSSYQTILSNKPTNLKRDKVIEYYDDLENFIFFHEQNQNLDDIKDLIIE
ncbi:MAG TPA: hypothetical protein VLY87_02100 [Flavobacterium sp.]|nr:hypothetical protein [Flavobacterium sp.]